MLSSSFCNTELEQTALGCNTELNEIERADILLLQFMNLNIINKHCLWLSVNKSIEQ